MNKLTLTSLVLTCCFFVGCGGDKPAETPEPVAKLASLVFRTAIVENEDPAKCGQQAAEKLQAALGDTKPKVVFMTECFEDLAAKEKALAAVCKVFGADVVVGGATYGMYTESGTRDVDAVGLLAIAGDVEVKIGFVEKMGAKGLSMEDDLAKLTTVLGAAGESLGTQLACDSGAMAMVLADAHSPKNDLFIAGLHKSLGKPFPITGGSVNKNAGQSYVFYKGKCYEDAAIGVMLAGNLQVGMAGRNAKRTASDVVLKTAGEAVAVALKTVAKPTLVISFDCAGRMGRLDDVADEQTAISKALPKGTVLFGNFCAGEYGPADQSEPGKGEFSSGRGWHCMITAIGSK